VSVRAMTWAWAQPIRPPARKFVLVAVADEADDAGTCWPSQGRIAHKCGLGIRSVRRHLAALEAAGCLTRSPRYREGRRTSDLYSLPANLAREVITGPIDGSARPPVSGTPRPVWPGGTAKSAGRASPIGDYMRRTGRWS
jgi:hypothetical protein